MLDPSRFLEADGSPKIGAPLGLLTGVYAALAPDRPALTADGRVYSRAEVEASANRRARQLEALGVGSHDAVIIALPNGAEFYLTTLACWKLGATPAHVSWRLTEPEFAEIVDWARPKLVVGGPAADRDWGAPSLQPGVAPDPGLSADSLGERDWGPWKMATSGGSTGRPKLVVDPNPAVWGDGKTSLNRRSGCTVINPGPLYHSAPFGMMIPGLCEGCHVVDMPRFDAERWLQLVHQHRPEWIYLVPTMMARIANLPEAVRAKYDVSSIKTLLHMAAPCPPWAKAFWIDYLGPDAVWEIYGGTERFGSTMISGREWLQKPGSVGKVRAGIEMRILDEDGVERPAGEVGEIFFRRPGAEGSTYRYVGVEPRRRGEWITFGDLGRVDEDGYLFIADRRTDMIVSGGANLYPAEIESAIDSLPGVLSSVVVGLPHPDLGLVPHAVVQVAPERLASADGASILAGLKDRLAITKHPRSIEFTSETIRDDAGKSRRSAWRDRCIAARAGSV
jgi:bile acid-coenzyme A ligase